MTRETTEQTPEVVMYTQALCGYRSAARTLLDNKGLANRKINDLLGLTDHNLNPAKENP